MSADTLSAFSQIAQGMSLQTILDRLGPPARTTGSGTHVLDYLLQDGSHVHVLFAHPQLIKITHLRLDGTKMSWVPSATL